MQYLIYRTATGEPTLAPDGLEIVVGKTQIEGEVVMIADGVSAASYVAALAIFKNRYPQFIRPLTGGDVQRAIQMSGLHAFTLRNCSICQAPIKVSLEPTGVNFTLDLWFDPNCDCVGLRSALEYRGFGWLAREINGQNIPKSAVSLAARFGIDLALK
jgi:hypothetical protein